MASAPLVSSLYSNFVVLGETAGVFTSQSYVVRVGSVPPTGGTCPTGTTLCSDGLCRASCGGGGSSGGGNTGGGSVVGGAAAGYAGPKLYLYADMGNGTACKVSLVREIMSGKNASVITNTLINAGGAECTLSDFRFTDVFPAGLAPDTANFSLPYASLAGQEVSFLFPLFLVNESRSIQYSFGRIVPASWLKEFNRSEVSARQPAVPAPSPAPEIPGETPAFSKGKIAVTLYPDSITIDMNKTVTRQVIIKNIGNDTLHSTQLLIFGLPSEFFTITPGAVDIKAGETQTFKAVFTSGEKSLQYPFRFIISSIDDNAEASSTLSVVGPEGQAAENPAPAAPCIPAMLILAALLVLPAKP